MIVGKPSVAAPAVVHFWRKRRREVVTEAFMAGMKTLPLVMMLQRAGDRSLIPKSFLTAYGGNN
jgi:hypothetical protein